MNVSLWWLTASIALCFFSLKHALKNPLAAITLLYTLLSGVAVLALNRYPHANDTIQMTLMTTTLWAVLSVVCVVIISEALDKLLTTDYFLEVLYALTLFNSGLTVFNFVFGSITYGNKGYTGLFLNASINGCLNAACIGAVLRHKHKWEVALVTLAVTLSNSSVPIGVLFVAAASYLISSYRKKDVLKYVALAGAVCLACGLISSGEYLFNSSYRFTAYKVFLAEWWERGMILFGTGAGTFAPMVPQMQAKHSFMMNWDGEGHVWLAAHSDWLQCLFELGIVGLVLYAGLFIQTTKRLYTQSNHALLSILCGIAATALFNYPFRYSVFGILAVVIVFKSLKNEVGGDINFPCQKFACVVP